MRQPDVHQRASVRCLDRRTTISSKAALAGCLSQWIASPAFAGNGLGDAIGDLISMLVGFTLFSALACALLTRFTGVGPMVRALGWLIAILSAGFCILALFNPDHLFWLFLVVPALAIFATFFLAGIFTVGKPAFSGAVASPSGPDSGIARSKKWAQLAMFWMSSTWIFWAVFSLVNWHFLIGFALPVFLYFYAKFWNFLWPPLLLSLVISGAGSAIALLFVRRLRGRFAPFLFNGLLLAAFLLSAELYKNHLIAEALKARQPQCVAIKSFLSSLLDVRTEYRNSSHASFAENGRTFYWSYATQSFIEVSEASSPTYQCTQRTVPPRN